mgnify:CR=1 FL=1
MCCGIFIVFPSFSCGDSLLSQVSPMWTGMLVKHLVEDGMSRWEEPVVPTL